MSAFAVIIESIIKYLPSWLVAAGGIDPIRLKTCIVINGLLPLKWTIIKGSLLMAGCLVHFGCAKKR